MTYVPFFKEPGLTRFLSDLVSQFEADHRNAVSKVTANHSVLLQSPAGKVYEVTIDDTGMLQSTLVLDVPPP